MKSGWKHAIDDGPAKAVLAGTLMALGLAGWAPAATARPIVLHVGALVDGDGTARGTSTIVVEDGKIVEVVPGLAQRPGAEVIDLSGKTVMPGLINAHVHLAYGDDDFDPVDGRPRSVIDTALKALPNFRAFLMEGFTTVRNLGSPGGSDLALERAARDGIVPGPRVLSALEPLSPTGGHSDRRNTAASGTTNPAWTNYVADGPVEFQRAVREHRRRGADLIKIMPSGGVTSIGDDPNQQTMTDEEIAATVSTAHALGMRVAAHAQSDAAIASATRLGVDSIEHGTLASEATFRLMKQRGTYLVPTMAVGKVYASKIAASSSVGSLRSGKMMQMWNRKVESVRLAYRTGVKMALGTDTSAADSELEFGLLREAGVSNADIVRMATANAADLLGRGQSLGRLKPGYAADIVAMDANPLDDVGAFGRISFVMKDGEVFKAGDRSK